MPMPIGPQPVYGNSLHQPIWSVSKSRRMLRGSKRIRPAAPKVRASRTIRTQLEVYEDAS